MTLFDALNLNREFLLRLWDAGGRIDDVDRLGLFADFCSMVASGHKVSYAVEAAAEKHSVSVRTAYAIVGRLKKPLQP